MSTFSVSRGAIAIAAIAVVAGGGAAVAAATSGSPSSNVYEGCLNRSVGLLYKVQVNPSSPPRCLSRDTLITWDQTGPAGAPGPQGSMGPAGPQGQTGAPGPQGSMGPAGPQGQTGAPGPQGATGPAGANGSTVLNGSGPPAAGLGAVGDFYIDTSASAIYGPKIAGGWGPSASLVGPKGNTGSQGPVGPQGPTGPQGPAGPSSLQVFPLTAVGYGTTTTLISTPGLQLAADCEISGLSIEITGAGDEALSDSSVGGHSNVFATSGSPGVLETLGAGSIDRGEYDAFDLSVDSLDGQWSAFNSGTGCEFQATGAVGVAGHLPGASASAASARAKPAPRRLMAVRPRKSS